MTQNREFSRKDVIDASRKFVCVRIDSYESEEAQQIVRNFLDGRFENTAMCVLSPDGTERLTSSGRGPQHVFRKGDIAQQMNVIAAKYKPRGQDEVGSVPDFPNHRLAVNVTSADQRLLIVGKKDNAQVERFLARLAADSEMIGRFHYDLDRETDGRIKILKADEFGQKSKIMLQVKASEDFTKVKQAILKINAAFTETEKPKQYSNHIQKGRQQGVKWAMPMPYGEDRDGNGVIDHK